MSAVSNQCCYGRTIYAIVYYIQIRFVLFYLFFIHALFNRYHINIPKQAHEKEQIFSYDCNRVVQAMDVLGNKTDRQSQPTATATWDWGTY